MDSIIKSIQPYFALFVSNLCSLNNKVSFYVRVNSNVTL